MNIPDKKIIAYERIKNLYRMSCYGLYGSILLSMVYVTLLWSVAYHKQMLICWSVMSTFNILCIIIIKKTLIRFSGQRLDSIDTKVEENLYFAGVLISAVLWIILSNLPVHEKLNYYFFSSEFIIGISVIGATGTLSLSQKSSISFILLVMTSFIISIFLSNIPMPELMSSAVFILMVSIVALSRYLYKIQMNSIMYKLINADLLDELIQKNTSISDFNEVLEKNLNNEKFVNESYLETLEFQHNILENSMSGTFVFDRDAHFIHSNRVGASILGYSKEELFGKSARIVFDKFEFNRILLEFEKLLSSGTVISDFETKIIRKDHSKADIVFNASPIFISKKITGSVCSVEDITEKKRIEFIKKVRIDILEQLTREKTLFHILHALLYSFKKLYPKSGCSVFLVEPHYKKLSFAASIGLSRPYRNCLNQMYNSEAIVSRFETIQKNKSIINDDIKNKNSFHPYYKNTRSLDIQSTVCKPIIGTNKKLLAVFDVFLNQPMISLHIDKQVIEEYAELIKVVIEKKSMEYELVSRNKNLSVLYNLSSAVLEEIELDNLFKKILLLVSGLHEYHIIPRLKIFIQTNDELKLHFDSNGISGDNDMCVGFLHGKCLCGICFENGEVIISDNSGSNPLHMKANRGIVEHGNIIIPLIGREKINGVLCLYTKAIKQNIEDTDKYFFLSIGRQIALALENASLYKELKEHSLSDPLTGLANRYRMNLMIQKLLPLAKRKCEPVSIALIDIDHFKDYNDTHGHSQGDRLLVSLSKILNQSLREEDLAVRYGGEEFLLIFANTNLKDTEIIVDRIRIEILNITKISISAGIAAYDHTSTFEELIELADTALYKAKNSGRNRVITASKN
ncbi:MAG: diguanylate cyclase [Spirochaetia bacterium]|nr:diguanylate cyclase [Spirochaetia bacterium]